MKTTKWTFIKLKGKIFVTRHVTNGIYLNRQPNKLHKIGVFTTLSLEIKLHKLPTKNTKAFKYSKL